MPLQRLRRAECTPKKFLGFWLDLRVRGTSLFTYTEGAGSFTSSGYFGVCGRVLRRAAPGPVGTGPAEVRTP